MSDLPATWRDPAGRFLPGGPGGPGNPRVRHLAELQQIVREAATPEKVRDALDRLHALGLAGDTQALRIWLDRVLGRPDAFVAVSLEQVDAPAGPPVPPTGDLLRDMRAAVAMAEEVLGPAAADARPADVTATVYDFACEPTRTAPPRC